MPGDLSLDPEKQNLSLDYSSKLDSEPAPLNQLSSELQTFKPNFAVVNSRPGSSQLNPKTGTYGALDTFDQSATNEVNVVKSKPY